MDLDELLALLGIESPAELVYFEQFADFLENPQEIPIETLTMLLEGMETEALCELIEGYFEELLSAVPDSEEELYTLLNNIGITLGSLARGCTNGEDDIEAISLLVDEFYKFRMWYRHDSCVLCTDLTEGIESEISLFEALTNYRAQSLSEEEYTFDFSDALDYQLEEYVVSLGAIIEDDYGDGDTYGEDEDYRDSDDDD